MEEKKLTDEEIVKALECCVKNDCEKCPYIIKGFDCVISKQAENDFLDLIHRLQRENAEQKAEIERLNLAVEWLTSVNNVLDKENTNVIAFNDALYREKEQAVKDTAKEILDELDLYFKGTTFRKGYEFKKIEKKLKEIAERKGVEVE